MYVCKNIYVYVYISNHIVIYLYTGGECEQYGDCIDRLKTQGSSTALPDAMDKAGVSDGMTSANANYNPHFHKFGTTRE